MSDVVNDDVVIVNEPIKRFDTISSIGDMHIVDYVIPDNPNGEYCVDDSHFVPMSEAVKQLTNSRPLTSAEVSAMYDFADGRDTGAKIPVQRTHGFTDIVDLSVDIRNQQSTVKDALDFVKSQQLDVTQQSTDSSTSNN